MPENPLVTKITLLINSISDANIDTVTNQDIVNWILDNADDRTLEGVYSAISKATENLPKSSTPAAISTASGNVRVEGNSEEVI